ncbi:Lnb N-terminal periplasmic domain-containing protein [Aquipseudomonas guryensis]|uniref:DUF4105 domain-containing protein n=1 Tax=Aquipseudomonas guryensis TaxID=2759165 RepID=A0A7W4DE75_9GAMM|nr:DUF4105 domain-containing protein [Pseudomonas guryensis]MBB1520939.1 DUF4105 domain-containing protein [Pseudomonas guryensis]
MKTLGKLLLALVLLCLTAWSAAALLIAGPQDGYLSKALATGIGLLALFAVSRLWFSRGRRVTCAALLAVAAAWMFWWQSLAPSNDRPWQSDVAVLPSATIDGNLITLHNVRNFKYRSEFDYTPAYYDKQVRLDELVGVDLIATYWMGPSIAHVFLSFAFADGQHVAVSIETRKEVGESYSTLNGFFRQYELYYVVADERDVIGLRTNHRQAPPEQVYLYRLQGDLDNARRLFMAYIERINQLHERPEFYNTLTTNCTTSIWMSTQVNEQHVPFSWKLLASGYVPQFMYEQGRLFGSERPFAELQRDALINPKAQSAGDSPDFSRLIRQP